MKVDILKEIKSIEERLANLKAIVEKDSVEKSPFKLWEPMINEEYHITVPNGAISTYINGLAGFDRSCIANHSAIKTEETAKKRANYLSAWSELAALAEQLNEGWEPDWNDFDEWKYFLGIYDNGFYTDVDTDMKGRLGTVYFKDRTTAQLAVATLSEKSKEILAKGYY